MILILIQSSISIFLVAKKYQIVIEIDAFAGTQQVSLSAIFKYAYWSIPTDEGQKIIQIIMMIKQFF